MNNYERTNNSNSRLPIIILLLYSIIVNITNFIINYYNKGFASLFYILITIILFYLQSKGNLKPIYFYIGSGYLGYMGTINIIHKYGIFSDTVFGFLYFIQIMIFLFIGCFIIGRGLKEKNE